MLQAIAAGLDVAIGELVEHVRGKGKQVEKRLVTMTRLAGPGCVLSDRDLEVAVRQLEVFSDSTN